MMGRHYPAGALLVALLALTQGCAEDDHEARIRALIQQGAAHAEAQQLTDLMALTADGFLAEPGALDRKQTAGALWVAFRRYGDFRVLYPRAAVTLAGDGQRATARVHFLVARRAQALPDLEQLTDDPAGWIRELDRSADLYTLDLELGLRRGDWEVRGARLRPFAGLGG